MSGSDSDVSLGDTGTTIGKWPITRIRLLIQLRLKLEAQFRSGRSRHLLWPQIYAKLKAADPTITETLKNVQKKFNNLMLTYKRIKSSSRNSNQSKWVFFDDFDEILSQFGDMPDENDQSNVRYVKVEQVDDDDSVSFSSDDGAAPTAYKNVASYKQEPSIRPPVTYGNRIANGIKSGRTVVEVHEPERDTKKRKLAEAVDCKVQKIPRKPTNPSVEPNDDSSWFREYVEMNERKEQLRHEQQMEMERKRLEVETKKVLVLRELVDVVKKFINK